MQIVMIVAADVDDAIGANGQIPWYLPADLKRFRQLTSGHVLIMGRNTYDSILAFRNGQPLGDGRTCLVVTSRSLEEKDGVVASPGPTQAALKALELGKHLEQVFVCGGSIVYKELLHWVDRVELTRVETHSGGDIKLPDGWLDLFEMTGESDFHQAEGDLPAYRFETYVRKP